MVIETGDPRNFWRSYARYACAEESFRIISVDDVRPCGQ